MERLMLAISLLIYSALSSAAVYRWVDNTGKVHYSDHPNERQKSVEIALPPSSVQQNLPPSSDRERLQQRLLKFFDEKRQTKKQAELEIKAKRKQRREKCAAAQKDLDKYKYASGIYEETESGERAFLSKEERRAYIKELENQVTEWCT